MITYDLMLEKQYLLGADRFKVAANANETLCLHFHFDRHWRCFDSKAAVFRNSENRYFIIEIINDRAKIPWEMLTRVGEFDVSVLGYENNKVITSDKAVVTVSESLLPEDYRTLGPSEELFGRFRQECTAQAYEKFREEIEELKQINIADRLEYGEKLAEAEREKEEAIKAKDDEIKLIENAHSAVVKEYKNTVAELESLIEEYREKAENWDLVDRAIQGKTLGNSALWHGGKEEYSLPMLNTSSVKSFAARHFDNNIREIGLDLTSVTSFNEIFLNKSSIRRLVLKNTQNIQTYDNLVCGCTSIRYLDLGDLSGCSCLTSLATDAVMLETVKFRNMCCVALMEDAFYNCSALKEIDGVFDMRTINDATYAFDYTPSLETVRFMEGTIAQPIAFAQSVSLTKESLMSIANGLSAEHPQTVTLSRYAVENAFPSEDERTAFLALIENEKGWELELQ